MRRLPFLGLLALLHGYIGMRLVPELLAWPWAGAALAAVLLASCVAIPLGFANHRRPPGRGSNALAWAGFLFLGLFSSLIVLTLTRDAVLLVAGGLEWVAPGRLPLDALVLTSAIAVPPAALGMSLLGLLNARRTATVVHVDVPIEGLPEALHGFRIAQVSDVHVGPTIRAPYIDAIVDAVNRLEADIVAITGDLVDGSVEALAEHVAPLKRLRSRHGSYFVTGNHEYYSGVHAWIAELRRLEMRVLLNEHVVLRHDGAELVVAGVADTSAHHFVPSHRSDPGQAIAGAPRHAPKLLLAHQPRSAQAAADAGFHLQLSGHTHGGQFLPWNFFVRLQQPFVAGLHRWGDMWVYTSRGTGYWGPPKRLGAPSEITLLRLVPAAR